MATKQEVADYINNFDMEETIMGRKCIHPGENRS